jgi:predicted transposase YbfD/YdcC
VAAADALHCNRRTVAAINAGGGDWCLALKANQDSLLSDARACFGTLKDSHASAVAQELGHGRTEARKAVVVSAKGLAEHHDFPGLKAFGRIGARRETAGTTTSGTRYFALSWMPAPEVLLATVRAHWGIENALHWQLDLSFREDAARNRKDNGPGNIAAPRPPRPRCHAQGYIERFPLHQAQASRLGRRLPPKRSQWLGGMSHMRLPWGARCMVGPILRPRPQACDERQSVCSGGGRRWSWDPPRRAPG